MQRNQPTQGWGNVLIGYNATQHLYGYACVRVCVCVCVCVCVLLSKRVKDEYLPYKDAGPTL
jgi:hypothetical protein